MLEDKITDKIIGSAIEVHKKLGPGLLEKIHENALCIELGLNNVKFETQKSFTVNYKGKYIGDYRIDIIVEDKVVVEIKSV